MGTDFTPLIVIACGIYGVMMHRFASLATFGLLLSLSCISRAQTSGNEQMPRPPEPKLTHEIKPVYPYRTEGSRGPEGTVVLFVHVNKMGAPASVGVLRGSGELANSATTAVRGWRWEPWRLPLTTAPVGFTIEVTVRFIVTGCAVWSCIESSVADPVPDEVPGMSAEAIEEQRHPARFSMVKTSRERSAVGALRTLNLAEQTYADSYKGGFACKLSTLGPPKKYPGPQTADAAGLIDNFVAKGQRQGYSFEIANCASDRYEITAQPDAPGADGEQVYCTNQTGIIATGDIAASCLAEMRKAASGLRPKSDE